MKTKKLTQLLTLAFCAIAFAFVTSCEGPAGPAGINGANGTDGTNGTNGADGNVTCLECHSEANMETISFEFATSQHNSGSIAVAYAGGRSSCAECHSHEGYVEFASTGSVAANFSAPSPWECSTCHNIHTTFESTDYAFRLGDAVTLIADGTTVLDEGNNNTCINCHQARRASTSYDDPTTAVDTTYSRKFTGDDIAVYTTAAVGPAGTIVLDGDTLRVTFDVPAATNAYIGSTHAGPHHGPQGNVWAGLGGLNDGTAYAPHADGCVVCHMGPESGHSFNPVEGNCAVCHSTDKLPGLDATVDRLEAIALKLEAIHAIHIDDSWESGDALFGAAHPVYASLTRAQFNAWWDFMLVLEDRSNGAHNPTYVDALLDGIETELGI